MKTIKLMIIALCMVAGVNSAMAQKETKESKDANVTFTVNMHCHDCEQKIKKNIPFEKGVKDMTTDLDGQKVTIKYRTDKTDKAKLQQAIEKLGYTCKEVVIAQTDTKSGTSACCASKDHKHTEKK